MSRQFALATAFESNTNSPLRASPIPNEVDRAGSTNSIWPPNENVIVPAKAADEGSTSSSDSAAIRRRMGSLFSVLGVTKQEWMRWVEYNLIATVRRSAGGSY